MKKPILFSAPMVRAILSGAKTQTRRVAPIEDFSVRDIGDGMVAWRIGFAKPMGKARVISSHSGGKWTREQAASIVASQFCPYGRPGDLLWVREAWRTTAAYDRWAPRDLHGNVALHYEADGRPSGHLCMGRLRASMHLPRAASRITLEVTGVRVERLQDISDTDAFAEGIQQCVDEGLVSDGTARGTYRALWESINGPSSWATNPWVWVVEFRIAHRSGE